MSLGSVTARNDSLASCYGDSHSPAWPDSLTLALYTGDPASGGTQLSTANGYAPITVTNNSTSFAAPSGGSIANAALFSTLPWSGTDSQTADHWAFLDGLGNVLDCGPITQSDGVTPMTVGPFGPGDLVKFLPGALVITA
jgi:hypothetical protein